MVGYYSSNKIRMTQNEHLTSDHRLLNFDRSVVLNLKSISYFYSHPLMANILEQDTLNLAGNLNSGLSYLITAVQRFLRMETLSDPDNRQKLTKHYTYLLT